MSIATDTNTSSTNRQKVSVDLHRLKTLQFITSKHLRAIAQLKQLIKDPAIDNRLIAIAGLKNIDERNRILDALRNILIGNILTHKHTFVPSELIPWALTNQNEIDYTTAIQELEKLPLNDLNQEELIRALTLDRALRLLINKTWLQDCNQ